MAEIHELHAPDPQARHDLLRIQAMIESGEISGAYAILSHPDGARSVRKIGTPIPCPLMESCLKDGQ